MYSSVYYTHILYPLKRVKTCHEQGTSGGVWSRMESYGVSMESQMHKSCIDSKMRGVANFSMESGSEKPLGYCGLILGMSV